MLLRIPAVVLAEVSPAKAAPSDSYRRTPPAGRLGEGSRPLTGGAVALSALAAYSARTARCQARPFSWHKPIGIPPGCCR
jgi:hypothetical protein